MTNLTRPVRRETASSYRGRPLICELHPAFLLVRLKGTRQKVTLDYPTALEVGYKLLARQKEAEKPKKQRKELR